MSKTTAKKHKMPEDFKWLMWGYNFKKMDPDKNYERIIVNTLNYGDWRQWRWLAGYYGKKRLKSIIQEIPESEFRNYRALRLISLILGIKKMHYANRGFKIQTERNLSRA
ncbi:MAG: hypothetical protein PHW31_01520 [Candidatus Pacebacteria bacterium]|nr:hypothetical protein [Candidatus Paceibacterota bacterium]